MTKMVATVAALQQNEQGNLDLDAPVADYCPEFADLQVLDGFDGDTPRLRAAGQPGHGQAAGHPHLRLGYWFWNDDLVRWEAATGTPNVLSGVDVDLHRAAARRPGHQVQYGINTDWLGKVIEAASGVALDVAVKEGITGPLGMDQTTFLMDDATRRRTPRRSTSRATDGTWVDQRDRAEPGAGVLGGRARAVRAAQRLHQVRAGAAARRRAGRRPDPAQSEPSTPRSPTRSATSTSRPTSRPPTRRRPTTSTPGPGCKWGYGLLLNTEDIPGCGARAAARWAGLCNTHFWVDRTTGICASIYSNFLPFVTPEAFALYNDYERALYAAL